MPRIELVRRKILFNSFVVKSVPEIRMPHRTELEILRSQIRQMLVGMQIRDDCADRDDGALSFALHFGVFDDDSDLGIDKLAHCSCFRFRFYQRKIRNNQLKLENNQQFIGNKI